MGMFDRDKEIGLMLTREFEARQEFILRGVHVEHDVHIPGSPLPAACKTTLTVSRLSAPHNVYDVTTLGSAIAGKADDAVPADFPVVVYWDKVETRRGNQATILQWVRPYDDDAGAKDDTPF